MLLRAPLLLAQVVATSFILWVCLSTAIPQLTRKYSSPENYSSDPGLARVPAGPRTSITDSEIYFVIAHPDDEVMFFLPALIELSRPALNNKVHLLCLSTGDAAGATMGKIRSAELRRSAQIMGLSDALVVVLSLFRDGMDEKWEPAAIEAVLKKHIKLNAKVVTFDADGVSGHPNHVSLFHGVKRFVTDRQKQGLKLYVLKSVNFFEKYSFTMLTNVELAFHHLLKLVVGKVFNINVNISLFNLTVGEKSLHFYSDLNTLSVSYAAMAHGHYSQMVWFRYGWLVFSRYLNHNQLVEVE